MTQKKQGRRSAEDAEKTKQHILNIATHLFSEHGFARVSLRHISEQANISHSLIRHHFGSKEQIWSDVCELLTHRMEIYCTTVVNSLPSGLPINEKLYQFAVRVLAFNLLNPQSIQIAADMMSQEGEKLVQMLHRDNELDRIVFRLTEEYRDTFPHASLNHQELKWTIMSFAHSAATFRPYLDSIWKNQNKDAGLFHHWCTFNLLMATKLDIAKPSQLCPTTLTELMIPMTGLSSLD